jgi:hypothetical protein
MKLSKRAGMMKKAMEEDQFDSTQHANIIDEFVMCLNRLAQIYFKIDPEIAKQATETYYAAYSLLFMLNDYKPNRYVEKTMGPKIYDEFDNEK